MNIETTPSARARMRAAPRECEECPQGARNNYFIGKRMPPQSYQAEQRFLNGRRQLINRAVLGWGVVYGFKLPPLTMGTHPGEEVLTIGEGLALDIVGRELWQSDPVSLTIDNLLLLDDAGKPVRVDGALDGRFADFTIAADTCWLLSAHYAEQTLDPVTIKGDCNCDRVEWDRTCETIVYSLRQIDCGDCCAPYQCGLACNCSPVSDCCGDENTPPPDREGKTDTSDEADIGASDRDPTREPLHARGGCTCLCEHLTDLKVGADCVRLRDIGGCIRADLDHGVSLACLKLGRDACGEWTIAAITDACGPRRLVKRNDLLFDLINGCDATHISATGWHDWHRRDDPPVPFDDFAMALGWDKTNEDDEVDILTSDFWVEFSRPVRVASLKPDCFVMAIMGTQAEGCWREYYRVPIVAVETEPNENPKWTTKATIVVDGGWFSDGLIGRGSIFHAGPTYVEITVRGDFIVDCLGQTVDANPRGLLAVPTGSDGPGDDYVSTFTVAPRAAPPPPAKMSAATRRGTMPSSTQGATP